MLSLDDYLSLFSPSVRERPRFMAFAASVLSQAADLLSLVQTGFPAAWHPDTAAGAQLDALGTLLRAPRPGPSVSDADARLLLRARVAAHHWDGTNEALPALLARAFPGRNARILDNQDGTVSAGMEGDPPFSLKELLPIPGGIRLTEV